MGEVFLNGFTKEEFQVIIREAIVEAFSQHQTADKRDVYLSRKETADYLKITLPTLDALRIKGTLKAYRIGQRVLYKRSEVDKSLSQITF